jgi:hypothetical protein
MAKSSKPKLLSFKLGWMPDIPDARDILYAAPSKVLRKLPSKVNLTSKFPAVYDQGELGSLHCLRYRGCIPVFKEKAKAKRFYPFKIIHLL